MNNENSSQISFDKNDHTPKESLIRESKIPLNERNSNIDDKRDRSKNQSTKKSDYGINKKNESKNENISKNFPGQNEEESINDEEEQLYDVELIVKEIKSTNVYSELEWIQILKFEKKENISHSILLNSLRSSIPKELRPRIWAFLSHYTEYNTAHAPGLYWKLCKQSCEFERDIMKDVTRTSPSLIEFSEDNPNNLLGALTRNLRAYANYDNEVGYVQGMNYIVAALLYNLNVDKYASSRYSFGKN